ncbi:hypothetical protein Pelo_5457 [Pelomyxa schiedti]|nr:hypothetical protein Pelo_5457 [Pelomyxa schiedti]
MVTLQVISDFHLEFPLGPSRLPQVLAEDFPPPPTPTPTTCHSSPAENATATTTTTCGSGHTTTGTSDVAHTESSGSIIPVLSEKLVIAGDMGYPSKEGWVEFMENVSRHFRHVVMVHGNHEFYSAPGVSTTNTKTIEYISQHCTRLGIQFLNHSSYTIQGIKFIGCSLWSVVTPEDAKSTSDYKVIWITEANGMSWPNSAVLNID